MKIFVSGKFEDRLNIRILQNELRKMGHEIVEDWTYHEYSDKGYPREYAIADIQGSQQADIYIGRFVADYNYKGALVEMGVCLGLQKPCYIIGHAMDSCIFINHPLVKQFLNDMSVIEFMRRTNGEMRINEKVFRWLRKYFSGYCPRCDSIGTWKLRNDTGLLLEFHYEWMECSKCGYKENE